MYSCSKGKTCLTCAEAAVVLPMLHVCLSFRGTCCCSGDFDHWILGVTFYGHAAAHGSVADCKKKAKSRWVALSGNLKRAKSFPLAKDRPTKLQRPPDLAAQELIKSRKTGAL
eukprot:1159063-Pelagomonas_calceolata.AAC.8